MIDVRAIGQNQISDVDARLSTFGTGSSSCISSTTLFNNTPYGVTELTLPDGGSYFLDSIELGEFNGDAVVNVTFAGNLTGGGTVTNAFTLDSLFGAQTSHSPASAESTR